MKEQKMVDIEIQGMTNAELGQYILDRKGEVTAMEWELHLRMMELVADLEIANLNYERALDNERVDFPWMI